MSQRDARWLTAALAAAERSGGTQRHGAVLVAGNRVVGRGWNRVRPPRTATGPVPWHLKWLHAEEAAVLDAGDDAFGAVLYVARLGRVGGGVPVLSEPCPRCWRLVDRFAIRKVRWT